MMSSYKPADTPNEHWTLNQWREAVQATLDEVVATGTKLDLDGIAWVLSTVASWNHSGIPNQPDAFRMAAILSHIAEEKNIAILSGASFYDHLNIFLRSRACKHKYATPSTEEISRFFRRKQAIPLPEDIELYSRVYPRPPDRLFGRNRDLDRVIEGISERPVTVIDGIGGDGKTALAWWSAKRALGMQLVSSFDWTTDKRSVIGISGKPVETGITPLKFEDILVSMAVRFKWYDVLRLPEHRLEAECADRLRNGFYLVVVDNLETVADSDMVVRRLQNMLARRGVTLTSRALVTSRVQVLQPDVWRVSIGGIEADEREGYIRYFAPTVGLGAQQLTAAQCHELATETDGNPLLMQIALARYAIIPGQRTFSDVLDDLKRDADDSYSTFRNLFEPLLLVLDDNTVWLAVFAAYRESIEYADLQDAWQRHFGEQDAAFFDAVATLVRYRILEPITHESGRYAMHSLVRAYLRALTGP